MNSYIRNGWVPISRSYPKITHSVLKILVAKFCRLITPQFHPGLMMAGVRVLLQVYEYCCRSATRVRETGQLSRPEIFKPVFNCYIQQQVVIILFAPSKIAQQLVTIILTPSENISWLQPCVAA